jgi:hypothetical protein
MFQGSVLPHVEPKNKRSMEQNDPEDEVYVPSKRWFSAKELHDVVCLSLFMQPHIVVEDTNCKAWVEPGTRNPRKQCFQL